jgi:exodeoxyribonuclease V beta subunit
VTTTFDPAGPLPRPGQLLSLEASAGTGKTWQVATLAARYIIEAGHPIDQIMVITFTRASTQELRDRVRDRLEACAAVLAGGPADADDPLLARLRETDAAVRRDRAAAALRDFDQAAIFTTHGFCDSMLRRLGVLVDHDPADEILHDIRPLTHEAAADQYLARYGQAMAPFSFTVAERWAREAMRQPSLPLVRREAAPAPADFADAVRDRVERAKRRARLYTYDDMLLRLRDALIRPGTGPAACARLAATFPVVLIDEFQDTDPVQWEILQSAFAGRSALVLIGDPKQSIYGFRGADVAAYLKATDAGDQATLGTNRRSAPGLVRAVTGLFDGHDLGDSRIRVTPVATAEATPRLTGADGLPWAIPLRLRVPADGPPSPVAAARELIDADLVADIGGLLSAKLGYAPRPGAAPRPLGPADIAIIVLTNRRGQEILDRLTAAGLPAIFTGAQSVFASPAAADWLALLRAVAEPRTARLRAAALSGLIGWSLGDLVEATPDRLADLAAVQRRVALLLQDSGPAAAFELLADQTRLAARLLAAPGGGRRWTDLRHLADLLQSARRRDGLDVPALITWLEARRRQAASVADESSRRLETDAPAIRMLTVHQAKGLQFPVVYLPQAADRWVNLPDPDEPFTFHDDEGRRWLDLGDERGRARDDHVTRHRADEDAEQLRVLYVALTRAACHVTAWWVPTAKNLSASALHRVIAAGPGQPVPASAPPEAGHPRRLDLPGVAVQTMTEPAPVRPDLDPPGRPPTLRPFDRTIDQTWRRTSYTALTASADHEYAEPPGTVPQAVRGEERASTAGGLSPEPTAPVPLDALSPMADLPGGVAFGSLVHTVFEYADPHDPDQFAGIVAKTVARSGLPGVETPALLAALEPGLHTPLGPIADDLALADLPLRDRLAELDFELPLAAAGRPPTLGELAALLAAHLPPGDPLAPYPERLRAPALRDTVLRGFLTGSIDAVLRLGDPVRYLVVDYKTNRLAPPGQPLRLGHYTPARLAEAMMASHYPLQALLYSVALHRFLRWRQPGYDPALHLGGIAYLFVRGLAGPATPRVGGGPTGVFAWRPPAGLVTGLDDLLAGRPT